MCYRVYVKDENRMIVNKQEFLPLFITNVGILKQNPHYEENLYTIIPYSNSLIPMRSTELRDKYNKTIFESDIIKVAGNDNRLAIGTVIMNDAGYWAMLTKDSVFEIPLFEYMDETFRRDKKFSRIEVIGNVYQNSDMVNSLENGV